MNGVVRMDPMCRASGLQGLKLSLFYKYQPNDLKSVHPLVTLSRQMVPNESCVNYLVGSIRTKVNLAA